VQPQASALQLAPQRCNALVSASSRVRARGAAKFSRRRKRGAAVLEFVDDDALALPHCFNAATSASRARAVS
jgi:hypothetical protein